MTIKDEILTANAEYARNFGHKGDLPLPPGRKFLILTCMDARLDPAQFAGFAEGDAHVFRNAGARATDDAIRSLVISHKLLGTKEWFVIHHTDCGMEHFTDEDIAGLLGESLETASITADGIVNPQTGTGSHEGEFIRWLTIKDHKETLKADVQRIRSHPLVDPAVTIHAMIIDVKTGCLHEVTEASSSGASSSGASSPGR